MTSSITNEAGNFNAYFEERVFDARKQYIRALISSERTSRELEELKNKMMDGKNVHQEYWITKEKIDSESVESFSEPVRQAKRSNKVRQLLIDSTSCMSVDSTLSWE